MHWSYKETARARSGRKGLVWAASRRDFVRLRASEREREREREREAEHTRWLLSAEFACADNRMFHIRWETVSAMVIMIVDGVEYFRPRSVPVETDICLNSFLLYELDFEWRPTSQSDGIAVEVPYRVHCCGLTATLDPCSVSLEEWDSDWLPLLLMSNQRPAWNGPRERNFRCTPSPCC